MTAAYATLAGVKARLGITSTTDDALIQSLADQVNAWIESTTGRILAPDPTTVYTQDGWDALEGGRMMPFPRGIRSLTSVEVAAYTGGPFSTVPATDWFLRPSDPDRVPGWPYTELWMTNIPSVGNQYPAFYPGFGNVRLTGAFGWDAIPPEITDVALTTVVRAWQGRQSGQADVIGNDETGAPIVSRFVSARDRATLRRYTIESVMVL